MRHGLRATGNTVLSSLVCSRSDFADSKGYCWITGERQIWLWFTLLPLPTGQFKPKGSTLVPECSSWLWQHCLPSFHIWWNLLHGQQHGEWGISFVATIPPSRAIFRDVLEEMLIYCGISLDTALTLTCHRSCVFWVLFREHGKLDRHSAWNSHSYSWLSEASRVTQLRYKWFPP